MTEISGDGVMVEAPWPPLPLDEWLPTYMTLHRWTQVTRR
jgi:hypothetical protein